MDGFSSNPVNGLNDSFPGPSKKSRQNEEDAPAYYLEKFQEMQQLESSKVTPRPPFDAQSALSRLPPAILKMILEKVGPIGRIAFGAASRAAHLSVFEEFQGDRELLKTLKSALEDDKLRGKDTADVQQILTIDGVRVQAGLYKTPSSIRLKKLILDQGQKLGGNPRVKALIKKISQETFKKIKYRYPSKDPH